MFINTEHQHYVFPIKLDSFISNTCILDNISSNLKCVYFVLLRKSTKMLLRKLTKTECQNNETFDNLLLGFLYTERIQPIMHLMKCFLGVIILERNFDSI